ncbi:MAG: helix-turn-helix transcriptional regulator [Clostridia bacterium]|nr:helix-turn-helix transcriptional regulator [Clostridia bacterium]
MIKEKRKILGYTQQKMADLLNISLRQYVRIDTEEDLPRRDILKVLIDILNLSNEEIGQYIRSITKGKK